jgi:GntR family transcriptional regulator
MSESDSLLQRRLDLDDDSPLYVQLLEIISSEIESGNLKPGDMLPSEAQLCAAFEVSRSTVRQAIGELESSGFVVRRRGKGSYISQPKVARDAGRIYSFTSEMEKLGHKASSKLVEFERQHPSKDIITRLHLPVDGEVFYMHRIRIADGVPLLLEKSYIPVSLYPELTPDLVSGNKSLYAIMAEHGVDIVSARETFEIVLLNQQYAKLLACDSNQPAFLLTRVSKDQHENICEVTQSMMRGDLVKYVIELNHDSATVNYSIDS